MDLVRSAIDFWITSYKKERKLFWVDAIGTITSILASLEFATGAPSPNLLFVFSFYLIGSACLQYTTYKRNIAWMFLLMSWYSVMNVIGIYNTI